ncbi:hypothetical protein REC12_24475 [Desulfosporosinus sp. PR]|uniref:hypothetical protein n=1 Tax=Candidatus Desulfosporosinus nitrosoreducens TaxID=3401928 RepID=UPI0027E86EFA|nr:hypothetical protein [Desulfosporosinus sp. PR]MDQ7096753.1 hypothetical protein [Desulfosporosinus sp. PR]
MSLSMSNPPQIDPRQAADIIKSIKQKAQIYTPEWKYDPDEAEGGAALAELFALMFGGTIDRLNRVAYKHYIEFLNLLEVSAQALNPAAGVALFQLAQGCTKNVFIRKGTQMYFDSDDDQIRDTERRIVFETERDFAASPANIVGIYSVDPRRDRIEKVELEQAPAKFFAPSSERSIQRHCFAFACHNVFNLTSPAEIVLSLENERIGYLNEEYVTRLADPVFARWSYFDGKKQIPFERVFVKDGKLYLHKESFIALQPGKQATENEQSGEQIWVYCEMKADGNSDGITMNRISAGSACLRREKPDLPIAPQQMYANDLLLDPEEGGYCFGKQPRAYDCFYLASEEVFSKCNARINLEFNLKTVVRQLGTAEAMPQYNFNRKFIVEKADIPIVTPDVSFISRIVWEYWNGSGWTHLKTEGDANPFQGEEGSYKKHISFQCPSDMRRSLQNSLANFWLRARVVEVENAFSVYANLLLPYVESVSLDFDYLDAPQPVEWVYTENNCAKALYRAPDFSTYIKLYQPLQEHDYAVYLAFDQLPAGYPLNLYFKTIGQSKLRHALSFEYFADDLKGEGSWYELKVNDKTEGLREEGIISLYNPPNFQKSLFFGQEGYWLRIVAKNLKFSEPTDDGPLITAILPNVVEIVQKQTISKEMFQSGIYEVGKVISLAHYPVLECQVWINEMSDIAKTDMQLLAELNPELVDIQYNSSGHISEFWVRWERCDSFSNARENSRHYKLDSFAGKILFGDGKRGKVPSTGENATIRVDYSYGGGRRGNLPAGRIEGLLVNIPYVGSVSNIEMTCGGSDQHDIRILEKVGPLRLRHRGQAVTASDYESMVIEQFPEVRDVRCIAHHDYQGQQAWGHVTLVILPYDFENRSYCLKLCKRISQYLSEKISCELLSGGRFSVVPAVIMQVSIAVSITVDNYDLAAETEKQILKVLNDYLNPSAVGKQRLGIEEIPTVSYVHGLLKKIKNVASIREVILEGRYYDGHMLKIVPLDDLFKLRYVVVTNGEHIVRIF